MTSILTNDGAMAALATLRGVNQSLDTSQKQASSGLRVATAADNAAYWSISTTMKSDIGAVSAVSDALALGAAKTETAYTGLDSSIDVLDQIKDKLVTAKEGSVDKAKVQTEIDQFKQQLSAIASSASFNGENWLNTSIADMEDPALTNATVVSSFDRTDSGISVNTANVDLWGISLFNSSGGGILQADDRSPGTIGGLRNTDFDAVGSIAGQEFTFSGPLVFTDDSTAITFDLTVDGDDPSTTPGAQAGTTTTVTLNRSFLDSVAPGLHGVVSTRSQFRTVMQAALVPLGAAFSTESDNSVGYGVLSLETNGNRGSSIAVSNVQSTLASGSTGGLATNPVEYGTRPTAYVSFDKPFHVADTAKLYIPVTVDGSTTTLTIDRGFVDQTLGTTTGEVTSATDLAAILDASMADANLGVTAAYSGSTSTGVQVINLEIDPSSHPESGRKSEIGIGPATDNLGVLPDFGVMDIDITSQGADIDHYLYGVEGMISKVTKAASTIGSLQSRIAIQTDFTHSLGDALTRGVGKLVDADMEETSAKLAADQTQQKLAVQSLSISNASPQILLQLFK